MFKTDDFGETFRIGELRSVVVVLVEINHLQGEVYFKNLVCINYVDDRISLRRTPS